MKQILLLGTLITSLLFSGMPTLAAQGGDTFYLETTFFPVYVSRNDTQSVSPGAGNVEMATESGLGFDFRPTFGYAVSGQFLFGLSFGFFTLNTSRPFVNGGDSGLDETTNHWQFGPTLGFLLENWRFLLTYWAIGERQLDTKNKDASGTTGDLSFSYGSGSPDGNTGLQLLIGYTIPITPTFQIGPSLVYRTLKYPQQSKRNRLNSAEDYDDLKLQSPFLDDSMSAMISLVFKF